MTTPLVTDEITTEKNVSEMSDRELMEATYELAKSLSERFDMVEMIAHGVAEQVTPVLESLRTSAIGKMLGI